jgi:hypothetical protein
MWPVIALVCLFLLVLQFSCTGIEDIILIESAYNASLVDRFIDKLRSKHIVMIGDSLMRYQYLALVFALRHHEFIKNDEKPNYLVEHHWGHWGVYLNKTNEALKPNEYCDCYRNVPNGWAHWDPTHIIENRYYIDTRYQINVTYVAFYGDKIQGVWRNVSDGDDLRQPRAVFPANHWTDDISEAIKWARSIVAEDMKPILILNVGMHPNYFFKGSYVSQEYCNSVRDVAVKSFDQLIWKTESITRDRRDSEIAKNSDTYSSAGDKYICSLRNVTCFYTNWTMAANHTLRPDNAHFFPIVYHEMNVRMMDIL